MTLNASVLVVRQHVVMPMNHARFEEAFEEDKYRRGSSRRQPWRAAGSTRTMIRIGASLCCSLAGTMWVSIPSSRSQTRRLRIRRSCSGLMVRLGGFGILSGRMGAKGQGPLAEKLAYADRHPPWFLFFRPSTSALVTKLPSL
jgi:hypothetical protein